MLWAALWAALLLNSFRFISANDQACRCLDAGCTQLHDPEDGMQNAGHAEEKEANSLRDSDCNQNKMQVHR